MSEEVVSEASESLPASPSDDHPVAVAASAGFGPLSERASDVWHGDSTPCASCAGLNARDAAQCAHCGQDLGQDMLGKMAKHNGPWFVFDHLRPFPGVSLERISRLIKRGVLVRTSIVRGPTTFYQWRYATETPLIARSLGRCWQCQVKVTQEQQYCPQCKAALAGYYRPQQLEAGAEPTAPQQAAPPAPATTATPPPTAELVELSQAVKDTGMQTDLAYLSHKMDRPLGKAPLIFLGIAIVVVVLIVTLMSTNEPQRSSSDLPAGQSLYLTEPLASDISFA